MQRQANTFLTLHIALFTPHTPHFTLALHLNSSYLSSSHLISCLPICQLSSSWLFTHREAFIHNKLLHREAFTHSKLSHTASVYTQNTYTQCFYTWPSFTHTHTNFYTETLLHTEAFTHSKLLHTKSFAHSKLLQKKVFTQRSFLVHNHSMNCSSKTGSRRQSEKKTIAEHFLIGTLKGKLLAQKLRKSTDKPKRSLHATTQILFTKSSCERQ